MDYKRKILVVLLVIVFLASYAVLNNRVDEKHVDENTIANVNKTNNSSVNQSIVVPLERPPFVENLP
jgi:hypothetical protein